MSFSPSNKGLMLYQNPAILVIIALCRLYDLKATVAIVGLDGTTFLV